MSEKRRGRPFRKDGKKLSTVSFRVLADQKDAIQTIITSVPVSERLALVSKRKMSFKNLKGYEFYKAISMLCGLPIKSREEIENIFKNQYEKGLIKYGTTLKGAKLSKEAVLNHLIEEVIDLNNYKTEYFEK